MQDMVTDIFTGENAFTSTVDQMSDQDSANTHEVISTIFQAMNTKTGEREAAKIPRWANVFPYVNGGQFLPDTAGALHSVYGPDALSDHQPPGL